MAVAQRMDVETYRRLAAAGEHDRTELRDGVLVEKPRMTVGHVRVIDRLARRLNRTLEPDAFIVSTGGSRLRIVPRSFAIPDLVVLPAAVEARLFADDPRALAAYDEPAPLVVEVWSPSTGACDLDANLPGYRARGDDEIWRLHPLDRSLLRWVRRSDGSYATEAIAGGVVRLTAIADVAIDLVDLFR